MIWPSLFASPAGQVETLALPSEMFTIVRISTTVTGPLPVHWPTHTGSTTVVGLMVAVGVGKAVAISVGVAVPVAVGVSAGAGVGVALLVGEGVGEALGASVALLVAV